MTVTVVDVEVVRETPPPIWLRPCSGYLSTQAPVESNGDLALVVAPLVSAIEQCDQDKKAIREWVSETQPPLSNAGDSQ